MNSPTSEPPKLIVPADTTPVFAWNLQATARIVVNQGGSSSGKTYSILQVLLELARQSPMLRITVTAESLPALRGGAIADMDTILGTSPFGGWVCKVNLSTHKYTLWNGSYIEFKAFKNVEAAKHGKRDILFINEATNVRYEIAKQLILRSGRVFIDFNPSQDFWVFDKYLGNAQAEWIYSNYRHNPFADPGMVEDIESLKEEDVELYKVYALGRRGNLSGQVFPNIIWVPQFPDYASGQVYGLDIGFVNSYTALCRIGFADRRVFGEELLYERRLTEPDINDRLEGLGISRHVPIICDSANASVIEYLRRQDWNIHPAKKGEIKGELLAMRRQQWCITNNSLNWKKEARNYIWKRDSSGAFENVPIKKFDHLFDAARYAYMDATGGGDLPVFSS